MTSIDIWNAESGNYELIITPDNHTKTRTSYIRVHYNRFQSGLHNLDKLKVD